MRYIYSYTKLILSLAIWLRIKNREEDTTMKKSVIDFNEARENLQKVKQKSEQEMETQDYNVKKKTIRLSTAIIILLTMALLFCIITMHQKNVLNDINVQHAYTICSLIDSQEEHLFLKYHILPDQVGLGTLRDAWKENPCYETAITYSDALGAAIERLKTPLVPDESGIDL
jgi:hypothetical protein